MRHGSRRAFQLVRVAAPESCLPVLTGLTGTDVSRAGGRARTHVRAVGLGAVSVKTSRQGAFWPLGGFVSVLTGRETGGPRGWRP